MDRIGSVTFDDRTGKGGEAKDEVESVEVKPTVVQVYFPGRGRTLAYYNEHFDLHVGDIVFVDGKLEGLLGRVTAVSTHFKVKKEDYKQVIGLADTHVTGQFFQANGHLITFDPLVLPWKQFCSWVKPPEDDAGYYVSYDGEGFALDDLSGLEVSDAVYERGMEYHQEDRVVYLCLNGAQGRAIVKGTRPYEVEFRYRKGQIGDLLCDCPCGYTCKHAVAVLLQLRETLEIVEKEYAALWRASDYFSIVSKTMFYTFAVDADPKAVLSLGRRP